MRTLQPEKLRVGKPVMLLKYSRFPILCTRDFVNLAEEWSGLSFPAASHCICMYYLFVFVYRVRIVTTAVSEGVDPSPLTDLNAFLFMKLGGRSGTGGGREEGEGEERQ